MIRRLAAVLLYSSCIAATVAWAQTPAQAESTPAAATRPSAATTASPTLRQDARAHDDADARECLEFLTNTGVIRCAEKYRSGAKRPAH